MKTIRNDAQTTFVPRTKTLLTAALMLVLGSSALLAQTARISGKVSDPDGAAIPGATVTLVHQGDLNKVTVQTDETGLYIAAHLTSGDYDVTAAFAGFDASPHKLVTVTDGQAGTYDIVLKLHQETEVVNVSAETPPITLDSASLSGTLSQREVVSFGLNGRNFSQLITLTPGVSNQTGQDEAKVGVAGSAKFSVNGGRVEYNTFEVDGSDVLNTSITASRGQGLPLMVYPSVDAIQELQVLTSNYSAQYGKSASGSVIVTTKSGTGQFHGNLYGFIRNEVFNARNYFDQPRPATNTLNPGPAVYKTPLYRRQDYGGTIGGPLIIPGHYNQKKDKTFFFFSEELRLEKTPVDYNQAVPTVAERGGDFSDICPLNVGATAVTYPVVDRTNSARGADCPIDKSQGTATAPRATANEKVNAGYIPTAILNSGIIPLPNSASGCNTTNTSAANHCYVAAVSPATYWREELFRIDHAINANELLSFRYVHDAWNTTTLTPQWGIVQNSFPTVENFMTGPGLDMVLSLAQTLPHGVLNRVSFAYVVQHISLAPRTGPGLTSLGRPGVLDAACNVVTGPTPTPPGQGSAQQLTECPLGYIFNNGFNGQLPGLIFEGNNGAYGGHGFNADTGYAPWSQSNPTYLLRDDVSKTFGKHTVLAGFEATIVQQNAQSAVNGANSGDLQGLLTFSNQQSKYSTGNAFADFLAGPGIAPLVNNGNGLSAQSENYYSTAIKSYTQDSSTGRYYNRYRAAEFYVEDDYKVSSRLTLNLGFRASLFGQWYNPRGTAYNWQPTAFNQSVAASLYVDPNYGELVHTTGTGGSGAGSLPVVALSDPAVINGLVQCGHGNVPNSCMGESVFNPAPRFGFAWDPTGSGRTSIRGGYGLFWEHGTGAEANSGSLIGSAPLIFSETQSFPSTVNIGVAGAGANGFPGTPATVSSGAYESIGLVCTSNCTQTTGATVQRGVFPLNVTAIPTKAHYSYTQQWSLSIQRELRKGLVGQAAYVGTKGTHLTAVRDLNQLPAVPSGLNPFAPGQPLTSDICGNGAQQGVFPVNGTAATGVTISPGISAGSPGYINAFVACTGTSGFAVNGNVLGVSADSLRPYKGYSNIISVENTAGSQYHGLQASLRQSSGPLTGGVSYSYSHSVDDASDRSSANFADGLNLSANKASSDFDQRHLLNVSFIYQLPLRGLLRHFTGFLNQDEPTAPAADDSASAPAAEHNAAHFWLDRWELSGIIAHETGTPFSIINAGGTNGVATADNAGVGNGLGIGSYADINPASVGITPTQTASTTTNQNIGPLLGNPNRFVAPRGLTFGNSGRNYLRNPTRTNVNMTVSKHVDVFKTHDLEFRAEAFNIFNHTQFRIYDPSHPGNTGNNVINCYGDVSTGYSAGVQSCLAGSSFLHPVDAHDPRILQFGLKLTY